MAFKTLTILEKNIGDPLDSVLTTRRTAAPQIIQPTYTFDPSDMYGFFVPQSSLGYGIIYNSTTKKWDVSVGVAPGTYLRESSIGDGFVWNGGLLVNDGYIGIYDVGAGQSTIYTGYYNDHKYIYNRTLVEGTGIVISLIPGGAIQIDCSVEGMDYDYIDGSLAARDASITRLFNWNISQDASIQNIDTSIALLNLWNVNQDTSIALLNLWNVNQDISIAWLDNARRLDLLRDVSIVDVSHNNLLEYDGNIGYWKNAFPEEVDDYFYTKTIIDASLLWVTTPTNSSTATQISFDRTVGYVYGTIDSPISSALTMNSSGALLGVVDLIIHKSASTGISVPSTFKRLSGSYDGSLNNFIYVQYIDASNQLYTISHIQ